MRNDPYGILREIACDLLAIAVKGAAYVHALFLETIGFELEDLMCVQGGRLDLDMAEDWLANSDDTLRWGRRDWYFRLCLAVAWFHRIHHLPTEGRESSIDEHLLRGIGQIVEDFLDFLDKITPSQLKRTGPFWRHFANWLCDLVENSEVAAKIWKWREKRSQDHRNEKSHAKGPREMPRSMRPLPRA